MAILVDELREYPGVELPFTVWCHMATDGSFDELHAFASRLRLRRAWFQRDHYDLPRHRRAAAVAMGAEEVPTRELLLRMAGPRGDRARRRSLLPSGVVWLRGTRGPDAPWGEALRTWLEALRAALAAGDGAVAVTTALRRGHRLGLANTAAAAGVPAHLVMLDADAELCRAGRAAQGAPRIPDGLFEHLLREWKAFRTTLETASDPSPFASIAVLDRAAADRLRRITISPSTRA